MSPKRIAIVGSGCSAIGALWALRNSQCTVHLYESENRLGGHTNTVTFKKGSSSTLVDAGFIALNHETYPNFVRFLDYLGVERVESQMALAFSRDGGDFEWAGTSFFGLFAQPSNLFRWEFWRMLFDIVRFNFFALDLLAYRETLGSAFTNDEVNALLSRNGNEDHDRFESIGAYLRRNLYSEPFIHNYLIPMLAATWCTRPDICTLECPARDVVRFMWIHHLLESIGNPLKWYTICGGARTYIDRFMALHPPAMTFLNSPVTNLERTPVGTVLLSTSIGRKQEYDHVILTTSAEISLRILQSSATNIEKHILGRFKTCSNTVFLHSDLSQMPRRRSAWSGWNYLASSLPADSKQPAPTVTFDMNTLQHVSRKLFGPVLFTMNPKRLPEPSTVQGTWTYTHPIYSIDAIKAQQLLPKVQGIQGVSFAGAWTGQGFHEDGFTSGIRAAIHILEQHGLDRGPESMFIDRHERALPCSYSLTVRSIRAILHYLHHTITYVDNIMNV